MVDINNDRGWSVLSDLFDLSIVRNLEPEFPRPLVLTLVNIGRVYR